MLSCGVLLTDGQQLLLGHATGQEHWDIPKGKVEAGESPLQAALRELAEETGLSASPQSLLWLGQFAYRPKKRLALFAYRPALLPSLSQLRCQHLPGHRLEFDRFIYRPLADLDGFVQPRLLRVIQKATAKSAWLNSISSSVSLPSAPPPVEG